MQIFRVNFYEPLRFSYFWSDDFIKGIARFLFCTLAFSLLVKYTLLWWIIFSVVLMIYEINHIWTTEMKWKWRNDRRSEHNWCNCVKKPEKNSGLQRGLNPWPRDLPVRCSNNWAMKPLTLGAGQLWFICSCKRNQC